MRHSHIDLVRREEGQPTRRILHLAKVDHAHTTHHRLESPGRGHANLPGPMYASYLRNMYLEATQEDHIVPWRSAYRTTQLVGGRSQFVLGASGHIAGVINPASKNKRSFWVDGKLGDDAEHWLSTATTVPGSWWTHWVKWVSPHAGKSVPARKRMGNAKYKVIEAAPGRHVKARAAS